MISEDNVFLFVVWEKARRFESRIREGLARDFNVLYDAEMTWPRAEFTRRLRGFYGFGGRFIWWNKARKCGRGPFRVFVVEDRSPVWSHCHDMRGEDLLADKRVCRDKRDFRHLTGHSNVVHSSVTPKETDSQLRALFGCGTAGFLETLDVRRTLAESYDFVVSLGTDCHCATMLRKSGLRSCSSPLDWVTGAPLETRLRLLETRFAGFLEKDGLRRLQKGPDAPGKGNDHYEDVPTGLRLYHDFRETLPFEEAYAQVKAKYDRRIARLYANVAAASRTLFVWCDPARPLDASAREAARGRLRASFPGSEVDLLPVSSDGDFALIRCPAAVAVRRRTERLRLLVRLLSWPHLTRAGRSAARRALERKWGLE